ncbi:hypothetical protein DFQ28_009568 [Apophysomyces sp. BC1034]|nr:hypothetical protein DFQ28_009568 [Apophysomyces sp. BC1034]
MEKYSRWRDPGTGIQPFLPPVPPHTESGLMQTLTNVIHYVAGPVQGILKLAVISVLALLYFILIQVLGTILSPLGLIGRMWCRLFSALVIRLVLFFSGFFYIKTETVSSRKSRGSSSAANKHDSTIQAGDVIVANWTSYIDILYLAYRFRPVFTQVYPATKQLRPISTWEAIRLCTCVPSLTPENIPKDQLYSVKELAQVAKSRYCRPVVVLPEGTTSNGRALLQFAPIFKEYKPTDRNGRFHVLAFKYEYDNLPPTYTVGNQFVHFIRLCSQFHNTLVVKYLAVGEAPCSNSTTLAQTPELSSLTGLDDIVGGQLSSSIGHIARLRRINLSMTDKRDFLQYYNTRSNGNKKRKL